MEKALTALGRTFIGAGVIVFLFVGYQLWGTNISEARAQKELAKQTEAFLQSADGLTTPGSDNVSAGTPNTTPAPPPAPKGEAVAVIRIPKIGLEKSIVEGTGVPDLKKGPGHYSGTPLPGQPGNAAIAGHRTTYGAPFSNLDKLKAGDLIEVSTKQGTFRYKVQGQQIVDPTNVSVLNPSKENKLTLTTCHPKFSAAQRLIITAILDTSPAPGLTPEQLAAAKVSTPTDLPGDKTQTTEPSSTVSSDQAHPSLDDATLSGESASKDPATFWGVGAFLVGLLTWALSRVWMRWPAYVLGAPAFLFVLFIFFENFSRLLPANA